MTEDITNVVGLDLGDRRSEVCRLDSSGEVVERCSLATTSSGLRKYFGKLPPSRVVIEAGTHSPWVSRWLDEAGHEVVVANPRRLQLISQNNYKNDDNDAELSARIGRVDPKLLSPVTHRSKDAQIDLVAVRARAKLVEARTGMINCVRGQVKSFGARLPKCSAESFVKRCQSEVPEELQTALGALFRCINKVSYEIKDLDKRIAKEFSEKYPETKRMRAIGGVGPLVAAGFVLTLESPDRFEHNRDVGPFLGLCPKQKNSAGKGPELRITKAGDVYLRKLLIQAAHYIIGWRGPDCDLRNHGLKLLARGGKHARQKAAVAVARKLAVLLVRLWRTGESYDPFYNRNRQPGLKVYPLESSDSTA